MSKRNNKQPLGKFEESMSSVSVEGDVSREASPVPEENGVSPHPPDLQKELLSDGAEVADLASLPSPFAAKSTEDSQMEEEHPLNMSKSPSLKNEDRGHPERKRRGSTDSVGSSTKASESGIADDMQCGKDDDDDDDNDDDDKVPPGHDPERLKAFNMFCRLFVDENLDRMVPISKQPKDKIQAILEACDRQFPEFHIRSRKRIRTYLKSCRRMRRSKEQNGWEPVSAKDDFADVSKLRPTPPHLTSAAAESMLANACENESNNAKRMRMGLEPLPASAMNTHVATNTPLPTPPTQLPPQPSTPTHIQPSQSPPHTPQPSVTPIDRHVPTNNDFIRHQPPPPAFRPPPEYHPPFFTNGNGLFRPGFPPGYQHPAHHHPPVLQHSPIQPASVQNGPTDLSMKKSNSKNQLSSSEVATIKQLIAGYRESAAFLYRSADELEQLLLQQN